ncbi:unnamed protein product [Trifolium pratense]|uniref:Uncharacterized protein n=1 Tax=Trifolium pratense TaxID=57577 RepID=A0ACB0IGA7_TRIPR|nr:unnamed protein product [Trifolium pratense]
MIIMQKHNHFFLLMFGVSCLFLALAFRFFFIDHSFAFSPFLMMHTTTTSPLQNQNVTAESPLISFPSHTTNHSVSLAFPTHTPPVSGNIHFLSVHALKCDIFVGDWVQDLSGPMYTNESCHLIQDPQNCIRNGRPDLGYLYWRWKPKGCELPKFNPKEFLHIMRNKSWAFIGDSISRNHVQSLLCILSKVEEANEVYHDEEYRSKIWKFPSHNFTLSVIWSPLLLKADIFEDNNGVSSKEIDLYLDILDTKWTNQFNNFDYVIMAGGKWFLKTAIYHENGMITGCHYCPGRNLTELGFDYAYRKVLQMVFDFLTNTNNNTTVLFRTTTPDHFENEQWFNGGYCNRTVPFKEGQIDISNVDSIMRGIELEVFNKTAATSPGENLKLFDTTWLSLLRPDGHPGPYRFFHPSGNGKVQNDCLHWCLPGPIDSWNDLLMQML